MLFKVIIVIFLVLILYSLGSALYYLVFEKKGNSTDVVKALTWRIVLSLALFVLLFVAYAFGWITPHQI
jgi:branched-subunit amino acid transport protein AzlD